MKKQNSIDQSSLLHMKRIMHMKRISDPTKELTPAEQLYGLGLCNVYKEGNIKLAVQCYKRAAELGHSDALMNLGLCYLQGNGVSQSCKKGIKYLKQCAKQG